MASGEPAGPRLQRLFLHFDPEAAGVVTILLGLFQVLLSVPLYHMPISLPKHSFLVPLIIGFVIVAAGAFVVANEKSPNRQLCPWSLSLNAVKMFTTNPGMELESVLRTTLKRSLLG
ncbi:uncharacterized protein si:dkey-9i23.16 isoform X2 [Osmerus mordax]|uniref:uncharacterized protein si:dkey-9i23.16 isoform X2 n=1 Tax=Osmerus mordax TaxID=8014 RepID=UPI00350EF189